MWNTFAWFVPLEAVNVNSYIVKLSYIASPCPKATLFSQCVDRCLGAVPVNVHTLSGRPGDRVLGTPWSTAVHLLCSPSQAFLSEPSSHLSCSPTIPKLGPCLPKVLEIFRVQGLLRSLPWPCFHQGPAVTAACWLSSLPLLADSSE